MKKLIFFGDITGRHGRNAVMSYLESLKNENYAPDFVIANVENASHGFGLTKKNYDFLCEAGVQCMTSGNHIWDKKDIYEYIDSADNLLRPINYPSEARGKGSQVYEIDGHKLAVINVLGRVFMPPIDNPWDVVINEIDRLKEESVASIFIDFHAEATAEKICFAKFLAEKYNTQERALIKGFFGTHTHVQTADENIINGMAYITDTGFCGSKDGVIGMEFSTSLKRLSVGIPERYDVAGGDIAQINGVEVLFDDTKSTQINRINIDINNIQNKKEAGIDKGD